MEQESETTAQREPGEDREDVREEEQHVEQQADGTHDDDDEVIDDDDEAPYESADSDARGDAGLMD
jgi:hypothetical protein